MDEYRAQIEKVKHIFGDIDHLDSHHGSASYPPADSAYEAVAQTFNLAIRPLSPLSESSLYGGEFIIDTNSIQRFREKGIKTVDSVNMSYWHKLSDPISAFYNDLKTIQPDEVREYMFHPATDGSQGAWRMKDLEILTNKEVIASIRHLGIQLTTYAKSAN